MHMVRLQFLTGQQLPPEHCVGDQSICQSITETAHVCRLKPGLVGIIALEEGCVDDNLFDCPARTEGQQNPVIARLAASPRFPSVAHVQRCRRRKQARIVAIMGIRKRQNATAIECRHKVDLPTCIGGVEFRHAIDPQPRHPAVGENVDAQMGEGVIVVATEIMVIACAQRLVRQHPDPFRVRRRVAVERLCPFDHHCRSEVAGKVRRINIKADDAAGCRQLDDGDVMATIAPPPRFPAVHPFAVVVKLAFDEDRRLVVQHALERREEFVRAPQGFRAQAS